MALMSIPQPVHSPYTSVLDLRETCLFPVAPPGRMTLSHDLGTSGNASALSAGAGGKRALRVPPELLLQSHSLQESQLTLRCVNLVLPRISRLPSIHCTSACPQLAGARIQRNLSYLALPSEHLFLFGCIQILRKQGTEQIFRLIY